MVLEAYTLPLRKQAKDEQSVASNIVAQILNIDCKFRVPLHVGATALQSPEDKQRMVFSPRSK